MYENYTEISSSATPNEGRTIINGQMQHLYSAVTGSSSSASYKVYSALLTQSSSNAPVATVLEDTVGDITWSYSSFGYYQAVSASSAFTLNKTVTFTNQPLDYTAMFKSGPTTALGVSPLSTIDLKTMTINVIAFQDGLLNNDFFEIRVYS
jgi:hypothetical protein